MFKYRGKVNLENLKNLSLYNIWDLEIIMLNFVKMTYYIILQVRKVTLMPGHGIGPEISDAVKEVFSAAEVSRFKFKFNVIYYVYGYIGNFNLFYSFYIMHANSAFNIIFNEGLLFLKKFKDNNFK